MSTCHAEIRKLVSALHENFKSVLSWFTEVTLINLYLLLHIEPLVFECHPHMIYCIGPTASYSICIHHHHDLQPRVSGDHVHVVDQIVSVSSEHRIYTPLHG